MLAVAFLHLLILIDCLLNWLLGGSINETLSSRAHRMREKRQRYFFWLAGAIDWIFDNFFGQADHCRRTCEEEIADRGALTWLGLYRS